MIRRVPKEFKAFDKRGIVKITTDIAVADDPRAIRAREVVAKLNDGLEQYWRDLRDGRSNDARARFEAAQSRARALGFTYKTAEEVAAGPLNDILKRLDLLAQKKLLDDETEVAAVLGGVPRARFPLSGLLEEYERLQRSSLDRMSPDQRRIWRNTRKRAIANLISVIGDKEISEITRDDTIAYRRWWQDRIAYHGLDIGTANKEIGQISKMVKAVDMMYQLNLKPVFAQLRIEGGAKKSRAAFTAEFVQTRILAPGALDGLNDEARDLVLLVADTGLRLSEAAGLVAGTIHLDADIPYVSVKPIDRILKTDQSERDIPLVGCALDAMKRHPKGFPRYRDKASSLSALVNKYLGAHGMRPSKAHSLYSLRHTFEDRLTAVEAPEKVIASLMGHKWIRPKYGAGPSLAQKLEWLQRIAFSPPTNDALEVVVQETVLPSK
ncbi:tyrosine-type recombinase/integrase [Oricola thermophila]|uniref:tyrosine-type recombinase/integrase n=1 Tax=Oricola thermophila TaxID=2742145 RepID=UPI001FE6F172|nr:tyrosine-type recombinase/integrase [Oricola thermophila]